MAKPDRAMVEELRTADRFAELGRMNSVASSTPLT